MPCSVFTIRDLLWLIAIAVASCAIYCAYAFVFWAWVTATPVTAEQLVHAQSIATVWLTLTILLSAIAVALLIAAIRIAPRFGGR